MEIDQTESMIVKMVMMIESFEADGSFKSDCPPLGLYYPMILIPSGTFVPFKSYRQQSPPIWKDDVVADNEDWIKSPYSLITKKSRESFGLGVSFKSDRHRFLAIGLDLPSSEKEDVLADDEGFFESSDDLMAWGSMESLESNDSALSFRSDQSNDWLIDFKDSVSPRSDFSSSEEEDVLADDDNTPEFSDDLGRDDPGTLI